MNRLIHALRIKGKYYNYLEKGSKDVEVRVGYKQIKKIKKGDLIEFENHAGIQFEVTEVRKFGSFQEMFADIPVKRVLPDYSDATTATAVLNGIYPADKQKLGVYAIFVKRYAPQLVIMQASELIKAGKHELFSTLMSKSYNVTDFISPDYPYHFEWFYTKCIPGVFAGTREVYTAVYDKKVVGVVFAKKDNNEAKVCTMWVDENMRGKHIATKLLEAAFPFLGTTKPLISVADYKLDMFKGVSAKYGWTITQRLENYYAEGVSEIVYNGTLD